MTGFGRGEVTEGSRKVTVELKSVNHRYLDVSIKMPKKLNFFDATIRNLLKEYIQRGKVDIFITFEDNSENNVAVKYHPEVVKEYLQYLNSMSDEFDLISEYRRSRASLRSSLLMMLRLTRKASGRYWRRQSERHAKASFLPGLERART